MGALGLGLGSHVVWEVFRGEGGRGSGGGGGGKEDNEGGVCTVEFGVSVGHQRVYRGSGTTFNSIELSIVQLN